MTIILGRELVVATPVVILQVVISGANTASRTSKSRDSVCFDLPSSRH